MFFIVSSEILLTLQSGIDAAANRVFSLQLHCLLHMLANLSAHLIVRAKRAKESKRDVLGAHATAAVYGVLRRWTGSSLFVTSHHIVAFLRLERSQDAEIFQPRCSGSAILFGLSSFERPDSVHSNQHTLVRPRPALHHFKHIMPSVSNFFFLNFKNDGNLHRCPHQMARTSSLDIMRI